MSNTIYRVLLLFLTSVLYLGLTTGSASAVTVKNCPKTISYSFTNFNLASPEQLKKRFDTPYEYSSAIKARTEIYKRDRLRNKIVLVGTKTGRCFYSNGRARPTTARFYTKNGRDLLRIMIPTRGERIGIYLQVFNYQDRWPRWTVRRFGTVFVEFSRTLHNGEFDSAGFLGYVNSVQLN